MAVDLKRDNYESEVFKSKKPVLVDFWGPQCGPCLALNPAVDRIEENYTGKIRVAKVNATENRMLCAKLKVLNLPTFCIYKDGQEIKRLVGSNITENDLIEAVKSVVE